jgi:hypothetical protein
MSTLISGWVSIKSVRNCFPWMCQPLPRAKGWNHKNWRWFIWHRF